MARRIFPEPGGLSWFLCDLFALTLIVLPGPIGTALWGLDGAIGGLAVTAVVIDVSYQRWLRWAVAPAGRIGPDDARRNLQLVHDRRRSVRWRAANQLRAVGPDCAWLAPDLIPLLKHSDFLVRSHAASALGRIGAGAACAVPALVEMLETEPLFAAFALRGIGAAASAAVPALIRAKDRVEPRTHELIDDAIARIHSDAK